MSMNKSDYYNELSNRAVQRISEIVQLLAPDRITGEDLNTLYLDCPCHSSKSKRSFHIGKSTGLFHCFGCALEGNIFHLTELFLTGKTTHGSPVTDTHRQARDWLADHVGMPRLSKVSTPEDAQAIEESERERSAVYAVLSDTADFYNLKALGQPDVIEFVADQWGFPTADIEKYRIGYADNDGLIDYLVDERGHDLFDIAATGAFRVTFDGDRLWKGAFTAHFENRITFPYHQNGQVVYMIGRRTPWTPDNEYEKGKYKKLLVWRDQDNRRHISRHIKNDVFFNEDVLRKSLDYVVISEGVTDCLSLDRIGIPSISPATTTFSKQTHEKLIRLLRRISTIYIANDPDDAGYQGAIKTGALLEQAGLNVRIVKLA